MPIPETLTTIRIAGDVRHPLSGAPGTGTVEFVFGYPVRDTANNVIFAPGTVTATVTAGAFTTDEFVSPRQAGVSPANQPLTVRILTDVYADEYQIEIPADSTGTLQLADLAPAESPPAVVTYALASALTAYLLKAGGTLAGPLTLAGAPTSALHAATKAYVDALTGRTPVALADQATITTDASTGTLFRVTLTANRTLANPTGPVDGQRITWEITQDATGNRTLALGDKFVFGSDITSLTLSTAAGATDVLGAQYNAADDAWRVLAVAKGF